MRKLIISLILIICMTINLVPILGTEVLAANAISSNIAKGKTVWQTGTGWGQTSVTNAVDGSTSTVWSPGSHSADGTSTVYMDLGSASVKYNKIKVNTTQWNSSEISLSSSAGLSGTHSISNNISSAKLSSATNLFTEKFTPAKVYKLDGATAGSGVTLPTSVTAASTYKRVFPTSTNRYLSLYNRVAASGVNGNNISEIELYYAPPTTMSIDINTDASATTYDLAHFDKATNTYYTNPLATTYGMLQLRCWLYDSEGDSLTNDTTAFENLTWWLGDKEGTTELNGIKIWVDGSYYKRFIRLDVNPNAPSTSTKITCKWTQNGYTTVTASMTLKVSTSLPVANFRNGSVVTNNSFKVVSGNAKTAFTNNELITRKTHSYSAEWNDMLNARTIETPISGINNLSYYKYVNLWVYSKDATGTDIGIMLYSDSDSYFRRTFKLDWAGWKLVSLPLVAFSSNAKNGVSPSLSNITKFALTCSGWNSTAATAADKVCIDAIWFNGAYPEWEIEYEFDIVNMNNANLITSVGATANTTYTKNAKYSLAWGDMTKKSTITFSEVPRDWSTFDHIQFSIYSEKQTTEAIKVNLGTDAHEASGSSYFTIDIPIDWQGWKTFTYRTCDITPQRTSQIDEVNSIQFIANGWGLTASSEPRIYIDSVTAYKYPDGYGSSIPYKYNTRKIYGEIKSGIKAVSLGSNMVLNGGTISASDNKVKKINGELLVTQKTLSLLGITPPSSVKSQTIDGYLYYPIVDILSLSGTNYRITDDELLIIANATNVAKIEATENLAEFIQFKLTYKDNINLTSTDFAQLLDNMRNFYAGTRITSVPSNYTALKTRFSRNNTVAKSVLDNLNKTDSTKLPLKNIAEKTVNAETAYEIYEFLFDATIAYAHPLSDYYHNTELKNAIIYCLDWTCDNLYGEGNVESARAGNWWFWEIGTPQLLVQLLVNMHDALTQEQIDKYLYPVNYLVPRSFYTTANKTDQAFIVFCAGILQKDSKKVIEVRDSYDTIFRYNESTGDGFYRDGSFIQHTKFPYIFSYGASLFRSLVPVIVASSGTKAEIVNPYSKNLYNWIFDSVEPFVYNGYGMSMLMGRNASVYTTENRTYATLLPIVQLCDIVEDDYKTRFRSFVKRFATNTFTSTNEFMLIGTITELNIVYDITNDTTKTDDYSIANVYPMMDRVVKNSDDFAVGIAMNSARVGNYECINGENMKGWYTSDGMTYIYTKNNYSTCGTYGNLYFQYVNPYRMPGTTVDTKERKVVSIQGAQSWLSDERFVGGTTLDEKYATAAMQLDAYSYTGTDNSGTYNNGLPYFDCDLEAKKAWFVFDDEVVCLGTDIKSTKDNKVETTVENMKNLLTDKVYVNDSELGNTSNSTLTVNNASWAHIQKTGGYVFPEKNKTLNLRRFSNTYHFTEMWFDHGKNPNGATYSYVILPAKSLDETRAYSENPDIEILSNTKTIQSVYDKSSESTGTIFWSASSYNGITTDKPLVTMQNESDGILTFSISDPTHNLTSATVTLDKTGMTQLLIPDGVTVSEINGKTKLTYNLTNSKGATFTVKFLEYTGTQSINYDENTKKLSINFNLANPKNIEKMKVIVAKYNVDDKLISAEIKEVPLNSDNKIYSSAKTYIDSADIAYVKMFVWDDLTRVLPIWNTLKYVVK